MKSKRTPEERNLQLAEARKNIKAKRVPSPKKYYPRKITTSEFRGQRGGIIKTYEFYGV